MTNLYTYIREAAKTKKVLLLMDRPLHPPPLLMARPLREELLFYFCGFPNVRIQINRDYLKTSHLVFRLL